MEALQQRMESLSSEVAQQRIEFMSCNPSIPTVTQPQTRDQQSYDVGTSEERFRRATEALLRAPGSHSDPSTPSGSGHNARPPPRRPSEKPKQPVHDNGRGRAPPPPPSPSSPPSGSDSDHSDRPRRPKSSPFRDKEIIRILDNIEKGYPDKQKFGGALYDFLDPKVNFLTQRCERKGLPEEHWTEAFPLMLTGDAQEFLRACQSISTLTCRDFH
ncbi:hypothetical protein E4U09_003823 [Claviceps aff. purpurea]|uniref:Uncharacterized protein n=1 Tax=Claviceps aff. purpurea TaxID=1967640 RepID=A0A9P7U0V6_9HYPO|nr:hypothetical protein E4U09_003823 [Claviceps aff. purpurea]